MIDRMAKITIQLDMKHDLHSIMTSYDWVGYKFNDRVMAKALAAFSRAIRRRVKMNSPVRTGTMKSYFDVKTHRGGRYSLVGVRRGYEMVEGEKVRPSKYFHLVEWGTSHSRAFLPLTRAVESGLNEAKTAARTKMKLELESLVAQIKGTKKMQQKTRRAIYG